MSSYRWNPYSQPGGAVQTVIAAPRRTDNGLMVDEVEYMNNSTSCASAPTGTSPVDTASVVSYSELPYYNHRKNNNNNTIYSNGHQSHVTPAVPPVLHKRPAPMPAFHHNGHSSSVGSTATVPPPAVLMAAAAVHRGSKTSTVIANGFHPEQQHYQYPQKQPTLKQQCFTDPSLMTATTTTAAAHQPTADCQAEVVVSGRGTQEDLGAKWVCYIRSSENDDLIRQMVNKAEPRTQQMMLDAVFSEFGAEAESSVTKTSTMKLKTNPATGALLRAPTTNHTRHSFHSLCLRDRGNVVVHLLESWGSNPESLYPAAITADVDDEEEEEEEATTTTITTTAVTTTTAEGEVITTETTTMTTTTSAKVAGNASAAAAGDLTGASTVAIPRKVLPDAGTLAQVEQLARDGGAGSHPIGVSIAESGGATPTTSAAGTTTTDYYLLCERAMRHHWKELTTSQFGAIALTRLFQVLPAFPYQERLARLTLQTATSLALHQFGNFMVSEVLKTAGTRSTQFGFVFDILAREWSQPHVFAQLAESRFGSHAIEAFLNVAPAYYILRLCAPLFTTKQGLDTCASAGKHRQGNYPMQALLKAIARGGRMMTASVGVSNSSNNMKNEADDEAATKPPPRWIEENPCIAILDRPSEYDAKLQLCKTCRCCANTAGKLEELRLHVKAQLIPQLKKTPYVKNMQRCLRTAPPNTTANAAQKQDE